jgi:origin recognition complex subunit 1
MPQSIEMRTTTTRTTRKALDQLAGRGLKREDSDDELGSEDHEWSWIYSNGPDVSSSVIQGARHGSGFRCMLGDIVLLKAEGERQAWVGIICEFAEDIEEDEKMANFMWFSTEKEIRNKEKKRLDFLHVRMRNAPISGINLGSLHRMNYT